jgi:hypothetical protein
MADQIICPFCKKEIALTDAISKQIQEKYEKSYRAAIKRKDEEYQTKVAELEKAKELVAEQVAKAIKTERTKIEQEAKRKLEGEYGVELKDLKQQIEEKGKKLEESQAKELALRKLQREFEEKQKSLELEIARRVDEARVTIKEELTKRTSEESRLKLAEKDKQLEDTRRQVEELKRKLEQGSQQTQGEVVELELERMLGNLFPMDEIEPISKGVAGADVAQNVRNSLGQPCGTILWEAKQAKEWSEKWLPKLREDQRARNAELAVLMTRVLPKGIENFAHRDGIWITNYPCFSNLAQALRISLIDVANAKSIMVGITEKKEAVYQYLTSPKFRHRVEAIVEAFTTMKSDLEQEKRAITKIWSKRETQIENVVLNTSGLYGDLQGIVGSTLPRIDTLELESLPAGERDDKPITEQKSNGQEDIPF